MFLRVGVVALQGDVSEHADAVQRALHEMGHEGEVVHLRDAADLEEVDAVVLPGGESTTISKLLTRFGLRDVLTQRAREEELPIMGTCAGLILLAKDGDDQVEGTDTELLGLMDVAADRNAFGRQRESFQVNLHVQGMDGPVPAVFIRAPAVTRTWGDAEVLARLPADTVARATGAEEPGRDLVVAARQGNVWALAFHPELTPDTRLHQAFLEQVVAWKRAKEEAVDG